MPQVFINSLETLESYSLCLIYFGWKLTPFSKRIILSKFGWKLPLWIKVRLFSLWPEMCLPVHSYLFWSLSSDINGYVQLSLNKVWCWRLKQGSWKQSLALEMTFSLWRAQHDTIFNKFIVPLKSYLRIPVEQKYTLCSTDMNVHWYWWKLSLSFSFFIFLIFKLSKC